jgi:hypothetical protein
VEEQDELPFSPLGGVAEGGVVGDLGQAQILAQLGEVLQEGNHAAVVGLEEVFRANTANSW